MRARPDNNEPGFSVAKFRRCDKRATVRGTLETTMEMIVKLDFLPGKKTYIVACIMLVYGLLSAAAPELLAIANIEAADDAQRVVMEGLLVLTGRRAIQRLES